MAAAILRVIFLIPTKLIGSLLRLRRRTSHRQDLHCEKALSINFVTKSAKHWKDNTQCKCLCKSLYSTWTMNIKHCRSYKCGTLMSMIAEVLKLELIDSYTLFPSAILLFFADNNVGYPPPVIHRQYDTRYTRKCQRFSNADNKELQVWYKVQSASTDAAPEVGIFRIMNAAKPQSLLLQLFILVDMAGSKVHFCSITFTSLKLSSSRKVNLYEWWMQDSLLIIWSRTL